MLWKSINFNLLQISMYYLHEKKISHLYYTCDTKTIFYLYFYYYGNRCLSRLWYSSVKRKIILDALGNWNLSLIQKVHLIVTYNVIFILKKFFCLHSNRNHIATLFALANPQVTRNLLNIYLNKSYSHKISYRIIVVLITVVL